MAENEMIPGGVSQRVDGAGGRGGGRIRVDAHMAEISSESRLEKSARASIEWMTGSFEDRLDDARSLARSLGSRGLTLNGGLFLLARFARFSARKHAGTRCLRGMRVGRAHDAIRYFIRLAFFPVAGMADRQFRADRPGAQQLLHGLIAGVLLQLQHRMRRRDIGRGLTSAWSDVPLPVMVECTFHHIK